MRNLTTPLTIVLLALGVNGCAGNKLIRHHVPAIDGSESVECPIEVEGSLDKPQELKVRGTLAARSDTRCPATSVETFSVTGSPTNDRYYRLAFVEFDDQGRLRKNQQFRALEALLESEAEKAGKEHQDSGGLTILVFVHGWRHNAAADDTNVTFAREVLFKTFGVEQQGAQYTPNGKPRRVVGIYVGWRGKSLTSPTKSDALNNIELASFWDRKSTAERVAVGSVRELFAMLKLFRQSQNTTTSIPAMKETCTAASWWPEPDRINICPKVRLFIVGHSFGGLLVFNAISESLIHSVRDHTDTRRVVGEYADLVLLVNPAIEGARYEPLHQAVVRRQKFDPHQLPVFISLTARDDLATGKAFPLGRWFSTRFDDERPSARESADPKDQEEAERTGEQEREANLNTMGHIGRYKTHLLTKVTSGPEQCPRSDVPAEACACSGRTLTYVQACDQFLGERLANEYLTSAGVMWGAHYRDFCGDGQHGVRLWVHEELKKRVEKVPSQLYTPVWIVESNDTDIIRGHSEFTGDLFRQYLVQLYHDRVTYGRGSTSPSPERFCGLGAPK